MAKMGVNMDIIQDRIGTNFSIHHKSEPNVYQMNYLHYHDNYELYILEDGQHGYLLNGRFFHVSPQDVILIPPNALHKSHKASNYKRTCIYFNERFLQEYFTQKTIGELLSCFDKDVISLDKKGFFQIIKIVSELRKDGVSYDNYHTAQYLSNILMILAEQKNNEKKEPSFYSREKINPILSYISQNYKDVDNLDELAEHFFVSKSYFCRIFKKYTGMTIVQYIHHVKIQHACEALLHTDENITVIAQNCGFSTSTYFCKIFKKLVGCTPNEYRNSTF